MFKNFSKSTYCVPPTSASGVCRVAPFRQWDTVSMEKAVAAVEKGESIRRAAEMFQVPRSTLHDRVSGRVKMDSKPGKTPYLSASEEEELV